jgi:ribonuclease P/MRP protein subunit POP5
MKALLPSLREKKRYLAYKINSNKKFNKNQVERVLKDGILKFVGELGYSKAGPIFLDYNDNKGILRINNKEVKNIRASLSLIESINKERVIFSSITTSGLLNKARNALKEG